MSRAQKVRGVVALALATLAAAACSSSQTNMCASTQTGGSGSGTSSCQTMSAKCAESSPDQASCLACNEAACPHGATVLNELVNCLLCTACYTACSSGNQPGLCGGADGGGVPAQMDPCDNKVQSTPGAGTTCGNQSGGCIFCAQQSGHTCEPQRNACNCDQDCLTVNNAILKCPAQ